MEKSIIWFGRSKIRDGKSITWVENSINLDWEVSNMGWEVNDTGRKSVIWAERPIIRAESQ